MAFFDVLVSHIDIRKVLKKIMKIVNKEQEEKKIIPEHKNHYLVIVQLGSEVLVILNILNNRHAV
jgi:hypothetical protein